MFKYSSAEIVENISGYLDGVKVTKGIVGLHPVVGLCLAKGRHLLQDFLWNISVGDICPQKAFIEGQLDLQLQTIQAAA